MVGVKSACAFSNAPIWADRMGLRLRGWQTVRLFTVGIFSRLKKTSEPSQQNIISNCENKKYGSLNFPTRNTVIPLKRKSVWLQQVATIQTSQPPTKKNNKKTGASTLQFHIKPAWIIGQVGFHVCFQLQTLVVLEGIILMARLVPTCNVSGCLGITVYWWQPGGVW